MPTAFQMTVHARRASYLASVPLRNGLVSFIVLAIVTLVILWDFWPLLAGWTVGVHDGEFHLWRLFELDRAIHAGVFYPRLAPDMVMGLSYPVFNYYAPLAAYLGEIGKIAGLSYVSAYDSVYSVSLVLGAWGMFLLLRGRFSILAGAAGAAAFALAPYQITDVFVRGAQAEVLAMGLLPWVLILFERLARSPLNGRVIAAGLGLAVLILSHNITALFSVPLIGGYYALVCWEHREARPAQTYVLCLSLAGLLAVGLTAFYWLPALWERDLVQIKKMTEGFFSVARNLRDIQTFTQATLGFDYSLKFQPGFVQMLLAALGLVVGVWLKTNRGRALFFGLVAVVTLWLQTPGAQFLWEIMPFGAYIQFPWRMMVFTTFATAWLTGAFIGSLQEMFPFSRSRLFGLAHLGLTAALIAGTLLASRMEYVTTPNIVTNFQPSVPALMRGEFHRHLVAVDTAGEYLPVSVTADPFDYVEENATQPGVDSSSDAEVRVAQASPFDATYSVRSSQPTRLILDNFYFPGWQAEAEEGALTAEPRGPLGQLSFMAPAGNSSIKIRFDDTPIRTAGRLATFFTLSVLAVLACYDPRWRWRQRLQRTLRLPGLAGLPLIVLLAGFGTEFAMSRALGGVGTAVATSSNRQLPVHAVFGDQVELAGASIDRVQREQPEVLGLTLYWHVLRAPRRDYRVHLSLSDSNGGTAGGRIKRPMFGLRRSTLWEAGMVVRDYQEVRLPPGTPAGNYGLSVSLVDEKTGEHVPVRPDTDGQGPIVPGRQTTKADDSSQVLLGNFRMTASKFGVVPAVDYTVNASFGGKMRLRGFSIESSSRAPSTPGSPNPAYLLAVQAGDTLRLKVLLETLADVDEDYSVFNHLVDNRGSMTSQQDDQPSRGKRPTTVWYQGDVHAEPFEVSVPDDSPPGKYALVTGLYTQFDMMRLPLEGNAGDSVRLGFVKVRPTKTADVYGPVGGGPRVFGGLVELQGFNAVASQDNRLKLGLLWASRGVTPDDYTVFVHITDSAGNLLAQDDGMPAMGAYPTSFWDPGDIIEDTHGITLPAGARCGEYQVMVGMYLLRTGERLLLEDGRDAAVIGRVPAVTGRCSGYIR